MAGGLGDLGRNIARWLVERGAANLILLSRTGPQPGDIESQELLNDLKMRHVDVFCPSCDILDVKA